MKTLLTLALAVFWGCGDYQQESLPPARQDDELERQAPPVTGPTKDSLAANLGEFYSRFAAVTYDPYDVKFDYRALLEKVNEEDEQIQALRDSIKTFISQGQLSRDGEKKDLQQGSIKEQLAFYLNAYNFLAIDIVIEQSREEGQLIDSIADIGGEDSFKAFSDPQFARNVAKESMTLDNIEKDTALPLVDNCDARLHFAFNCASQGCPILEPRAFYPDTLEAQLNFLTQKGLRLSRVIDANGDQVKISSLFKWFKSDYVCHGREIGGEEISENQAIKAFIQEFFPEMASFDSRSLEHQPYNWDLNQADAREEK